MAEGRKLKLPLVREEEEEEEEEVLTLFLVRLTNYYAATYLLSLLLLSLLLDKRILDKLSLLLLLSAHRHQPEAVVDLIQAADMFYQ